MVPDSTTVQTVLQSVDWLTWATVVGALAAVAAAVIAWVALAPQREARRKQRQLEDEFGSGLYDAATIERSTRYYVEPDCTSVDPAVEAEMRNLMSVRESLMLAMDRVLETDSDRRFFLILADSGMGKTSFVLNYYARNQARKRNKRHRIAIVPLGVPGADERIKKLEEPRKTTLFLDALDEDAQAIENYKERVGTLVKLCQDFRRVIITCRTQFFPSDEEIVKDTGLLKVTPTAAGEKRTYEFWKFYLAPLTDAQVDAFLQKRYSFKDRSLRKKAKDLILKVPLLSVRPMLLAHIPDLLATEGEIRSSSDLYARMINAWIVRESAWVDGVQLQRFSEMLALDLHENRNRRVSEMIPGQVLGSLAEEWGIKIDPRHLTGRSLLNRDAQGNYKFAHRSIMEYLVVQWWFNTPEADGELQLTDQMKWFFLEKVGLDPAGFQSNEAYRTAESVEDLVLSCYWKARPGLIARNDQVLLDRLRSLLPWRVDIELVDVPEGEFTMGGGNAAASDELPAHEVSLSTYSIGKYPITNRQYQEFVETAQHPPPAGWKGGRYPKGKDDHPVTTVSWNEARAYCEWLSDSSGWRFDLPTEAQWEKAARGTDGRTYPWGNDWKANHSNTNESGIKTTTPVGQFSLRGDSPFGCADMAGNVWEWCRDWYEGNAYGTRLQDASGNHIKDPQGPRTGESRSVRGGSFFSSQSGARCAYRRWNLPDNHFNDVGFRVVLLPFSGQE